MRLNKQLKKLGKNSSQRRKLVDIAGALNRTVVQPGKNVDTTFGIYRKGDGELVMGNKIVEIDDNKKTVTVDGREYDLTPGLKALIMQKHPLISHWPSSDYQVYKSLSAQTKVRPHPNPEGAARPHATWKYKHLLRKMVVSGERIVEEEASEESEDTDTSSDVIIHKLSSEIPSFRKSWSEPASHIHTRSYRKAKKTRDRGAFYQGFSKCEGVVNLPGDINRLAAKLQLLAAEFVAGNTTVRNELVHVLGVLDVLLRLKQLTRKDYTNITAGLAA